MEVGRNPNKYQWYEQWAKIPITDSSVNGWAHNDMVVSKNGDIIGFHQADPTMLIFDHQGNVKKRIDVEVNNAHGMAIVNEAEDEFIWMADNTTGKVLKVSMDGTTAMSISPPDIEAYVNGKYSPTSVAINEVQFGGNGDIWVADGYGQSYIHRYDSTGNYIASINGAERDGGKFEQPHGIWIDTRKSVNELYIADRANGRVQVYDLEGNFIRTFGREPGKDWLHSPSAFAVSGELMFVAELRGSRVTILDQEDNLIGYIGENSGAFLRLEGWPNVPQDTLEKGMFNSPHGIAADKQGNVFISDWLIGGRITKLSPIQR